MQNKNKYKLKDISKEMLGIKQNSISLTECRSYLINYIVNEKLIYVKNPILIKTDKSLSNILDIKLDNYISFENIDQVIFSLFD